MLERFITDGGILLQQSCTTWEDAIDRGAAPLLAADIIEPSYVEAIKVNHRAMPYMVIAPGIMLAHARPECGAHAVGITLMTLSPPIPFGSEQNDPVSLVISLATPDDKSHVQMLEALTDFLMNDAARERFLAAKTADEARAVLTNAGTAAGAYV